MVKRSDPIAEDGVNRLFIGSWKSKVFGIVPHVVLTIGPAKRGTTGTLAMKLTPADARRTAIELLQIAESLEGGSK